MNRGYCGIGIYGCKTKANLGTLWRSAAVLGANFIFTVGRRYKHQSSDTTKAWKHIPMFEYTSWDDFVLPKDCVLVGVEQTGNSQSLVDYKHHERAVYILGAEDAGLPSEVLLACHQVVEIPSEHCLNVAAAGSIVLYDRLSKGFPD